MALTFWLIFDTIAIIMKYLSFILILSSLLAIGLNKNIAAANSAEKIYIIPIKGVIDLGLSSFIKRSVEQAKEDNAAAIIFEIDTFGGRVDAAVDICTYISSSAPIPTYAYITNQAWSAGALISLACKEIYMATGSSIGSAEPRVSSPFGQQELSDEKTISAIRAKFKSIAEENNHSPNLAQAMVDKDIELKLVKIKGEPFILTPDEVEEKKLRLEENDIVIEKNISPKDKLLNLTAQESKTLGLAKDIYPSREELLKHLELSTAEITETSPNWAEIVVRFLTHPILSSLLLMLGMMGLFFELRMPGWGVSGTVGLLCLALFFWGHYLVGLANWFDVLLFAVGIILIMLEIFVIPGFGFAGILGIISIIISLFLALIKHPLHFPTWEISHALYIIAYAFIGAFLIIILTLRFLPQTTFWKKFILAASEKKTAGFKSRDLPNEKYLGKIGKTTTVLRPSGKAIFDKELLDVVTDGEFIEKNTFVVIAKIEKNRIMVVKKG
ncbi:MAG: NfeD family protein [Candidatus Omnitrophota bacterium]